jgi:hypothetical protein
MGPSGSYEEKCHVSGYGEGGRFTFNWKMHCPYENFYDYDDYDDYLFGNEEMFRDPMSRDAGPPPDILVLGILFFTQIPLECTAVSVTDNLVYFHYYFLIS